MEPLKQHNEVHHNLFDTYSKKLITSERTFSRMDTNKCSGKTAGKKQEQLAQNMFWSAFRRRFGEEDRQFQKKTRKTSPIRYIASVITVMWVKRKGC